MYQFFYYVVSETRSPLGCELHRIQLPWSTVSLVLQRTGESNPLVYRKMCKVNASRRSYCACLICPCPWKSTSGNGLLLSLPVSRKRFSCSLLDLLSMLPPSHSPLVPPRIGTLRYGAIDIFFPIVRQRTARQTPTAVSAFRFQFHIGIACWFTIKLFLLVLHCF